jgi:threonine synthase
VYVPAHASPVKQRQIAVYGAKITPVPGPRSEAALAVRQAVEKGAVYASTPIAPFMHRG